jgi:hypothetical protein
VGNGARVACVLVAALTFAACSSGGNSGGKSTQTSTPLASAKARTAAACVLVQQPDATALIGRAAKQVAIEHGAGSASRCGWQADTNPDPNALDDVVHSVTVYVYDGTNQYAERYTRGAQHVDGIGDRAFTFPGADTLAVEFVKNGQTVLIRYSITGIAAHPSPAAARARLVGLARIASGRM